MRAGRSRGISEVRDRQRHDGHHPPREGPNLDTRLTLRPPEAAQALGVSERTLRKWMRDGGLPYLRRDGIVLIPRAELEDWLRDQVGSSNDTDELAREILRDL